VPALSYIVTALLAYLLGSIPTGYIVARARGVDIRTVGSGNIGATNAFRVLGKKLGSFVLLIDALKGYLACALIPQLVFNCFAPHWSGLIVYFQNEPAELQSRYKVVAGIAAILGHNYTCWLRFKGGKGIATSAGVLLALVPWSLAIILSLFIILFVTTRYVSIGSIAASFTLPFATWFTTKDTGLTIVTGAMGALAILKHRKNIQRLLNGTENRIQFKKREATP
jgi:glycerol-3-phosphate acyltransferase PlsY